jgi:formylglycine-generating enzyme required for sulfatase activity
MTWPGTYDMAGNVEEWIWNEAKPGSRYFMGGAWNEPTYTFFDANAISFCALRKFRIQMRQVCVTVGR